MPFYEYACKACGLRFERFQRMSDDPIKVCPDCCGEVVRVVQPVGVIFKGSGFYVTDNRSSSSTAPGSNHKPTNGGSGNGKREEAGAKNEETAAGAKADSHEKTEKAEKAASKTAN